MNAQGVLLQKTVPVSRRVIPMIFSRDFESMLLNAELRHDSLSADIEQAAKAGIVKLNDLLDVHELAHQDKIKLLVSKTAPLCVSSNVYFAYWHVSIDEELLDEVDLATLTHGDDLNEFGLKPIDQSKMLVLLAVAGCVAA